MAVNSLILMGLDSFEVQILSSLWQADQASAFLILKSVSVLSVQEPKYLKLFTILISSPFSAFTCIGSVWLKIWSSVFLALHLS